MYTSTTQGRVLLGWFKLRSFKKATLTYFGVAAKKRWGFSLRSRGCHNWASRARLPLRCRYRAVFEWFMLVFWLVFRYPVTQYSGFSCFGLFVGQFEKPTGTSRDVSVYEWRQAKPGGLGLWALWEGGAEGVAWAEERRCADEVMKRILDSVLFFKRFFPIFFPKGLFRCF